MKNPNTPTTSREFCNGLSSSSLLENPRQVEHMRVGDKNVAIRISQTLHTDFHRACKQRGTSVTHVLKQLMSDWVAA